MAHLQNYIGKRFGNVKVIEFAGWKNHERVWKYECDCGNKFIGVGENVERGQIKSCGCMKDKNSMVFLKNAQEKALRLIDKTEDCWIWKGLFREKIGQRRGFFPYFNFCGKQYHPVRFFKQMLGETIPTAFVWKRTCTSQKCVNPSHFIIVHVKGPYQKKQKEHHASAD